ncbi:acyl carrier protein [Geomonas subterranea]|uniref:Acyl carrier protein n=1 Tax=Geomonas subterranea TaxID=2847989 RepID=A0ABX8LKZ7_9BACT|nr:acyl carrier protein [Geomonas subterranea]QXE91542.1 acyl carrier protein [Geomonas subterranea]QXM10369.1 acyl carrier protein [Geomonas subterranea]
MTTIERVNAVFRNVFDDDEIDVTPAMTANDVEGWDSLSHVNLLTALELDFGIRFSRKESFSFKCVGDMLSCIEAKLAA